MSNIQVKGVVSVSFHYFCKVKSPTNEFCQTIVLSLGG